MEEEPLCRECQGEYAEARHDFCFRCAGDVRLKEGRPRDDVQGDKNSPQFVKLSKV